MKRILGVLPTAQLADPVDADLVIAPASDTPIDQPGLWWLGLGPLDISEEARAESKTLRLAIFLPLSVDEENGSANLKVFR